ncbi:hypothetical protein Glove_590g27 [Diversispora epigaea]|uniref:Uncharacterized protein n=1 Tax=Diversispora epigaea TaxID=1348612 RepID=A0A397G7Z6_9GLOM|nr:hypothetical protein Glove_590g27 [Diversispora epigaea]
MYDIYNISESSEMESKRNQEEDRGEDKGEDVGESNEMGKQDIDYAIYNINQNYYRLISRLRKRNQEEDGDKDKGGEVDEKSRKRIHLDGRERDEEKEDFDMNDEEEEEEEKEVEIKLSKKRMSDRISGKLGPRAIYK